MTLGTSDPRDIRVRVRVQAIPRQHAAAPSDGDEVRREELRRGHLVRVRVRVRVRVLGLELGLGLGYNGQGLGSRVRVKG